MPRLRICIFGAGAIGGWLGVLLAEAGHEVSMVARGAHLDAIREHGCRLEIDGRVVTQHVRASAQPADLGEQDYVVLATKTHALAAAAASVAPLLGRDTALVSTMNGVPWWFLHAVGGPARGARLTSIDPDGAIGRALDPARVLGVVIHASSAVAAPGVIRKGGGNRVIIGEPDGSMSARLERLHAALRAAGLGSETTRSICAEIWAKLIGNLNFNPISALVETTTDRLIAHPDAYALCVETMREALAIADKLGLRIDITPEQRIAVTAELGAIRSSMLQDLDNRKPLEIDALVAAPCEIGRLVGVPTPHIDAVLALIRLKAALLGL